MTWLAAWWRRGDQFEWLSEYLASRRLQFLVRFVMATSTATLSAIALAMTWSPAGPHRLFGVGAVRLAVIGCVSLAVMWMLRWPTRRQSQGFAVFVVVCAVVGNVSYADPLVGLIGCTTFGVVGGYIAFFHSARLLVFNFAAAAVTTLALKIYLAKSTGYTIAAVCVFFLVAVAVVAVPFTTQALVYSLEVDVMNSDVDPLCGLLNRRAFYRTAEKLMATRSADRDGTVNVMMIDLDEFKKLNDSRGHVVGDRALVAVADILRRHNDDAAAVARVGGEEFLVLDVVSSSHVAVHAELTRQAIAAAPYGISASVGIASSPLDGAARPCHDVIDELICLADAAMYDAKRAGGNQVRHRFAAVSEDQGR